MSAAQRAVLVTGASSGIGAAAAKLLAAKGFRVYGASRKARPESDGIRWLALDVRDEASVRDAMSELLAAEGTLYGAVCNAGIGICQQGVLRTRLNNGFRTGEFLAELN